MKIVDLIKTLEEELKVLEGESYQRHTPEYADEHMYYNALCESFDEIDGTALDLLRKKIQNENKDYENFNIDYESHLKGLVAYNYAEREMNLHDIVEKVIIPELIAANKWIYSLGRK